MKKLALIGAVSAFALIGGMAFAEDIDVGVKENAVAVAGTTAVAVSDTLNGNKLFSDNTAITKIFAPQYEDESTRISIGDIQVNNVELDQVVPNSQFGVFVTPFVDGVEALSSGRDEHSGGSSDPAVSVYSGAISGNAIGAGNGIFGVNLNTAPANMSNISQINVGKVYAR